MTDFLYPHRVASLRERLPEADENNPAIAALIVSDLENCRYLTGFSGSNALVIVTQEQAIFFTDGRYEIQAAKEVPGFERLIQPQGTDLAKASAEEIRKRGIPGAGFEEAHLSVKAFNALRTALDGENGEGKNLPLIGKSGYVESVRALKDADEIARIRLAVALADRCFDYILTVAKTGMTERELAWKMEVFMRESGASHLSFDSIVGSGANSALIHGRPGDRIIGASGEPEFILLDFGAELGGYCSDITRTVVVGGAPTDKQRAQYDAVLKAQVAAIDAVKPGAVGKDIHAVAAKSLEASGYGQYFPHGTGHQLGRVVHDGRALGLIDEVVMRPGMVVTVEPGAYVEGFGGVRIEDVVVVTETGCEILTGSTKELIALP
ncbi:MAG: aminopeptidase P family protein [Armatimonadetes bacterium]|nr:aminopeptidase P family protein [Armatimonadota bacterium]